MKTNYFNRIFGYAWVFKKYFILNTLSNIFYALFGTLSMISLFPMLKVLFNQTQQLNQPPVWEGIAKAANYFENYLNYFVTTKKATGNDDVLIFIISLIILFNAKIPRKGINNSTITSVVETALNLLYPGT